VGAGQFQGNDDLMNYAGVLSSQSKTVRATSSSIAGAFQFEVADTRHDLDVDTPPPFNPSSPLILFTMRSN
jgi:hypothetical protein